MVSERDRRVMTIVGDDLGRSETNNRGTPEQRASLLRVVNADRVEHGYQPFDDRAPEEGFHERARSLGMARIDR